MVFALINRLYKLSEKLHFIHLLVLGLINDDKIYEKRWVFGIFDRKCFLCLDLGFAKKWFFVIFCMFSQNKSHFNCFANMKSVDCLAKNNIFRDFRFEKWPLQNEQIRSFQTEFAVLHLYRTPKKFWFSQKMWKTVKKCVLALIKAPPKTVKLVKWNRIYKAAISHSGLGPECDIAAL